MKFRHAVLLAALAGTGNAMAQISADASMSGMRYELFDLDPDDGITASLTIQPGVWEHASAALISENPRAQDADKRVYYEAHASAVSNTPLPVPEAPTVAMLFAGLGVLLLRIRHAQNEV